MTHFAGATLRYAVAEDLAALVQLNQFWLKDNLAGNTSRGFVGGAINEEAFAWMIAGKLVVVAAETNDKVVGYFLSYNRPSLPILAEHLAAVEQLKVQGRILPHEKVAIGIQSAIHPSWQGSGLIVALRQFFLQSVSGRFQWLYTTIATDNERSYKSATRFGWQVTGQDEHHFRLILAVP